MSVRVVLLAEGKNDLGGPWPWTAPGQRLGEDELGPAHVLVRRAAARVAGAPEEAVVFFAPPRTAEGRRITGSQLHDERTLRRVALAVRLGQETHAALCVVLVDDDGRDRRALEGLRGPVVGVAVQELESGFAADPKAWGEGWPGPPEVKAPGEVKALVDARGRDGRADLAAAVDLGVVARVCPSFERFLRALAERWAAGAASPGPRPG